MPPLIDRCARSRFSSQNLQPSGARTTGSKKSSFPLATHKKLVCFKNLLHDRGESLPRVQVRLDADVAVTVIAIVEVGCNACEGTDGEGFHPLSGNEELVYIQLRGIGTAMFTMPPQGVVIWSTSSWLEILRIRLVHISEKKIGRRVHKLHDLCPLARQNNQQVDID